MPTRRRTTTRTPRAAIYCRISDDRQGLEAGVRRQEADCRALAEREGWQVIEPVYVDNDISAYSGAVRPAYRRLLADIGNGEVDALVVWHTDRLHRQLAELEGFIGVVGESDGIPIRTVQAGSLDLATAEGRMMARIQGTVARHSSERASERIQRAHEQAALEGRRHRGGARPFGYSDDGMHLNRREANAIRKAAHDVLTGVPAHKIALRWNDADLLSPRGNRWSTNKVTTLLKQASLAGLRVHERTGLVTQGTWPAIISQDEHALLQRKLAPTGRTLAAARKALMTGIVRCAVCGRPLLFNKVTEERYRYVCSAQRQGGCGTVRASQGRQMEIAVVRLALSLNHDRWERYLEAAAKGSPEAQSREQVLESIRALDARDAEMADMLARGEMSRADFTRARHITADQRVDLEHDLRDLGELPPAAPGLIDAITAWASGRHELSEAEQEQLRAMVVASLPNGVVYVAPSAKAYARLFDASRLQIR